MYDLGATFYIFLNFLFSIKRTIAHVQHSHGQTVH